MGLGVSGSLVLASRRGIAHLKHAQHDDTDEGDNEERNRTASQASKRALDDLVNLIDPRLLIQRGDNGVLVKLLNVALQAGPVNPVTNAGDVERKDGESKPVFCSLAADDALQHRAQRWPQNAQHRERQARRQDERNYQKRDEHKFD